MCIAILRELDGEKKMKKEVLLHGNEEFSYSLLLFFFFIINREIKPSHLDDATDVFYHPNQLSRRCIVESFNS